MRIAVVEKSRAVRDAIAELLRSRGRLVVPPPGGSWPT